MEAYFYGKGSVIELSVARKGNMSEKYKVEEVKEETKDLGFNVRTTSRDSNGKVAVSDWQPSKSGAVRQSRERLSEPAKKK
jgi:hypothetical protein